MKTLLVTLTVILTILQAINAEHQHEDQHQKHHKKDQLGFFGSRGKRSTDTDLLSSNDDVDVVSLKELSGLRDTLMNMQRDVRAPKGFYGMRGKKDYDLVQQKRALLGVAQNLNGIRERQRFVDPEVAEINNDGYPAFLPKRAPAQGFFGMRGKKFGDYDLVGGVSDKRAPKGFMGMRGKKSGPDTFDDDMVDDPQMFDYNYNSVYDKRAPSGFMGVRGKKLFTETKQPLMFRR